VSFSSGAGVASCFFTCIKKNIYQFYKLTRRCAPVVKISIQSKSPFCAPEFKKENVTVAKNETKMDIVRVQRL